MRVKEGNKETDILKAAIKVFAESGYHKAKMSKIAEVAEVASGSLYLYYKNKEEILMKVFDNVWTEIYKSTEILVQRNDLNSEEKLDSMLDLIFDTFSENPDIAIIMANEQKHFQLREAENFTPYFDKFIGLGQKIIGEGIKVKVFNKNIDINILKVFILGAFSELIVEWAMSKGEISLNLIRSNFKYLLKHGILNPEGK